MGAANDTAADDAAVTTIAAIAAITGKQDKHSIFRTSDFKSISNHMQAAKKLAAAAGNHQRRIRPCL